MTPPLRFVASKKLNEVRFFGKIMGLQSDYYIVESARWYEDKNHKNYAEKNSMPIHAIPPLLHIAHPTR